MTRCRRAGSGLAWAVLALTVLVSRAGAQETGPSATTALYVREDTDRTTVIAPRVHVDVPVAESTRIDLIYTLDAWTSASIDIRTSASRRLDPENSPRAQEPVTEQRDEINAGVEHAFDELTLSGVYRYSTEPDYESHGGAVDARHEFAENNASVALGLRAFFDTVGRAGDSRFAEPTTTLSARAAFGQVLGTHSLMELVYELGVQRGFLSSPYRYVRFAADRGVEPSTCLFPVDACLPEQHPGARMRHALALYGRHAFGDRLSLGANYRFYLDDWEMTSHTIALDGALVPGEGWVIALGYRFYRQSSAYFFEPFYAPMPRPRYYTSDKELTALSSHRVELELGHSFTLDEPGSQLKLVLALAPTFYLYHEFLPIDSVTALETTVSVGVTL